MRKLGPLYINEMQKLTKRVLVLVGVLSLLAVPLLVFMTEAYRSRYEETGPRNRQEAIEAADDRLRMFESRMQQMEEEMEFFSPDDSYIPYLRSEIAGAQAAYDKALEIYEEQPEALSFTYLEQMFWLYSDTTAVLNRYDAAAEEHGADSPEASQYLQEYGYESRDEAADKLATVTQVLDGRTIADYLKSFEVRDPRRSPERTDDSGRRLELWQMVEEDESWLYDSAAFSLVGSLIDRTISVERALVIGLDTVGWEPVPLTPRSEEELRQQRDIYLFQLDNTAYLKADNGSSNAYQQGHAASAGKTSNMLTLMILVLGMMMVGASTVSQEIETGTVKALIISPARRWKILMAKFVSLLTLALALFIIKTLWIQLLGVLFFRELSQPALIINLGGSIMALPGLLSSVLVMLAEFGHVTVYIAAALALSTVIRKTAISVGLSIGLFFSSLITMLILSTAPFREAFRLLPFLHMDLGARVGQSFSQWLFGGPYSQNHFVYIPVWMSAVYLLVFVSLLLWISLDSFGRRDI